MAKKNYNLDSGELHYNGELWEKIIGEGGIPARQIMQLFNHTNPSTINRWRNGGDIYLGALLKVCNTFGLNVLQFLIYDGKPIETHIENLYRMEAAGIDLRRVLEEHGVEPYEEDGEHKKRTEGDIELAAKRRRLVLEKTQLRQMESKTPGKPMETLEIIDRITTIQREGFEHERKALEALRKEMQEVIDDKDEQITQLKLKLARVQREGFLSAVSDEGGADDTAKHVRDVNA